eukprot:Blabericola_migrator_1__3889@NODE_2176_length_3166_cov_741_892223_g1371_i0_p1_GENE_NODE_2176_length_3166_cov_741_892223_g1371_i0NODE_2176_length_3166_cov_741_892223_g1371_i0_p1_ORF_typecomplete_len480_score66_92RRM_1/PF00076_22/1_1e09RRM_7/PF16367_5/1_3e05RRM_3/PF08777_11/0_41RL/PF17797_1/0_33_NODE_2176_length_3166_cov_741_892223_g1371_i01471586
MTKTSLKSSTPTLWHQDSAILSPGSARCLPSASSSPCRSPMTSSSPSLRAAAFESYPDSRSYQTPSAAGSPSSKGAQFTIIANVPYDTVRQDLVTEFRKFGRVELAMVVCDEASRHPHKEWTSTAGYAFVRFSKRAEAAAAIQAATMGLITIRGTRVRADWARKDSYAKRGRVSAAQGAPTLGPYGIPDGISMLQSTLRNTQPTQRRTINSTYETWPTAMKLPDFSSTEKTDDNMSVLETLAQALSLPELVSRESQPPYPQPLEQLAQLTQLMRSESSYQPEPDAPAAEPDQPVMLAAEKLCSQLVEMLSDATAAQPASCSSSISSNSDISQPSHDFQINPTPPHLPFHEEMRTWSPYSAAPTPTYDLSNACQIADLLSPTSRGLLSYALSDVLSPPSRFPPDVSPIYRGAKRVDRSASSESSSDQQAPEHLLKLAVSGFDERGGVADGSVESNEYDQDENAAASKRAKQHRPVITSCV